MLGLMFGPMLAAGVAGAAPALPPGAILVVGDSLSAGFGVDAQAAWPALLDARLQREKLPYRVVNASVSGQTSAGGRALLGAALKRHAPVLVIVQLGANDALRGQDLGATRANLAAMIDASRAAGARVLLAGIELPPNYGARYSTALRQMYADLAAGTGVAFVPFLLADIAADRAAFQADGLHPTAPGLAVVADTMYRAIGAQFDLAHAPGRSESAAPPPAADPP